MITRLSEYIVEIEKFLNAWNVDNTQLYPWFRGHAKTNWELCPTIFRHNYKDALTKEKIYNLEKQFVNIFKIRSIPFISTIPSKDVEWTFLMQHYGMPTRLLDWSESFLVALYFAVNAYNDPATKDNDGIVWILNPTALNDWSVNRKEVFFADDPLIESMFPFLNTKDHEYESIAYPVAIQPPRSNIRLRSQKGVFTLHGTDVGGIESIPSSYTKLDYHTELLGNITVDAKFKIKFSTSFVWQG